MFIYINATKYHVPYILIRWVANINYSYFQLDNIRATKIVKPILFKAEKSNKNFMLHKKHLIHYKPWIKN